MSGSDTCVQFAYGGCRGTANNFETEEECNNSCRKNKATMQIIMDGGQK